MSRLPRPLALLLAVVVLSLATPQGAGAIATLVVGDDAPISAASDELTPAKAVVLGVVEGITEYLPVSSTGHLLVTQRILDVGTTDETKSAADSYAIAIQAGAILAVLVLYWRRILSMVSGLLGRDPEGRAVLIGIVLATLPAAAVAFVFEDTIKEYLLGAWPVVAAWAVGGAAILVLAPRWERRGGTTALEEIAPRQALIVGVVQCLALWPGTSRSLVTILAALAVGMTLGAAVEFSFLLGLVTLGGATTYEALSNGGEMVDAFGFASPLIGLVAAFVAAVVAVRWMVEYLKSHGLAVFGWYRLGVAAVVAVLLLTGTI
jgi:undecaprenyl-diphosphatase